MLVATVRMRKQEQPLVQLSMMAEATGDDTSLGASIPPDDALGCVNAVPVLDYVKSTPLMSQMLKYLTRYIAVSYTHLTLPTNREV